ncbi:MAG: trypsin-like peptidase domain-containing protein [Blautia sp.]|nr:trypsin-like peptidase domain-containing protein [Blautia sp.]
MTDNERFGVTEPADREPDRTEEQRSARPSYNYYRVGQQPEKPVPVHKKKRKESFGNRILRAAGLAAVAGLVFSLVFQGVNLAVKKVIPSGMNTDIRRAVASTEMVAEAEAEAETGVERASDTDLSLLDMESETSGSSKGPVADVAAACMPSVVAITTVSVQEITDFFYGTRKYQSAGTGSGIIVGENDEELLIATNNHVVSGASTLSVCFMDADVASAEQETIMEASGRQEAVYENAVSAQIKGTDEENDLAVVAVRKEDIPEETMAELKIATLGDSDDLVIGEQVVAIGNALGYGQSVTSGWVSALHRSFTSGDESASDLIQTDAAINPGNSGGALLNMQGELVGINSAKSSSSSVEGMGYAIPISKAMPILENLMTRKTRTKLSEDEAAYLGVTVADLSREAIRFYNMPQGAFVTEALSGGPAEEAGILRGDIIVSIDGQKVDGRDSLSELLAYYAAGETVDFVVERPGETDYEEQTIEVTFGHR